MILWRCNRRATWYHGDTKHEASRLVQLSFPPSCKFQQRKRQWKHLKGGEFYSLYLTNLIVSRETRALSLSHRMTAEKIRSGSQDEAGECQDTIASAEWVTSFVSLLNSDPHTQFFMGLIRLVPFTVPCFWDSPWSEQEQLLPYR